MVTVDFFLCSLVRRGPSQPRVFAFLFFFLHFLLPASLLFTCFCLLHAFPLSTVVYFHSIQSFSGGTPFVNYHVSASAGGALVSLEYLIHLFLYVRLLYILFLVFIIGLSPDYRFILLSLLLDPPHASYSL